MEHIALANGSKISEGQTASPGDKYFEVNANGINGILTLVNMLIGESLGTFDLPSIDLPFIPFTFAGISFTADIYFLEDYSQSFQTVYDGSMNFGLGPFQVSFSNSVSTIDKPAFDTGPGGVVGRGKDEVDQLNPTVDFKHYGFCHTPIVSVLGIDTYDFFMDVSNHSAIINSNTASVDAFAADDRESTQLGVTQHNQKHGSMSDPIGNMIITRLIPKDAVAAIPADPISMIPTLDGRTFNVGESQADVDIRILLGININPHYEINTSIDIVNSGNLLINHEDLIDFTDVSSNPDNTSPSHLDVFIRKPLCSGTGSVIDIQDGILSIGDWTGSSGNTADVYLGRESKIIVQQNGLLEIDDNSKLIIQSGAEVIVEAGGILSPTWHSQLIVEAGGILRIESGGMLRPMHSSQVWIQPGGQLLLDGGAKVQLWDGTTEDAACNIKLGEFLIGSGDTPEAAKLVLNGEFEYSGTGYFDIHPHASIELVGDTNFKIDGYGKGYRFLKLSNGGTLRLNKNQCQLRNGEVEYAGSGTIRLTGTASGRFFQTEFTGHSETRKAPILSLNLKYFANQRFV